MNCTRTRILDLPRQIARDQKLIVAKASIGCLQDMLCGSELIAIGRVGVHACIGASKIPCASRLPTGVLRARVRDEHLGALVVERIIDFAAQQDAKIPRIYLQREFGASPRRARAILGRRIDLFSVDRVGSPFVPGFNLVRLRRIRRNVVVLALAGFVADR